jgi:hypothetical protein
MKIKSYSIKLYDIYNLLKSSIQNNIFSQKLVHVLYYH